jgi:hypothetical protein
LHLAQQFLRVPAGQVDADLPHDGDHLWPHGMGGLGAGRLDAHVWRRLALEERLGHLGAPGVVVAHEQHALHVKASIAPPRPARGAVVAGTLRAGGWRGVNAR